MIEIQNLTKEYSGRQVLHIPQLQFSAGQPVGILGNNGAGKTTLFNLMLDLVKPTSGQILSKGQEVSLSEKWKKYTSAWIDEGFLISFLTPEEYFAFVGKLYDMEREESLAFAERFEDIFNGEILGRNKLIRDLSKGNQKKVGLIGSLIGSPEWVFWDEPFANLDPSTQLRLKRLVIDWSKHCTFLISSHDLNHVYDACERILILDKGVIKSDLEKAQITLDGLIAMFTPGDELTPAATASADEA